VMARVLDCRSRARGFDSLDCSAIMYRPVQVVTSGVFRKGPLYLPPFGMRKKLLGVLLIILSIFRVNFREYIRYLKLLLAETFQLKMHQIAFGGRAGGKGRGGCRRGGRGRRPPFMDPRYAPGCHLAVGPIN